MQIVNESQSRNLSIFPSLRFYVKSNLAILGAPKTAIFAVFRGPELCLSKISALQNCKKSPKSAFKASKMLKRKFLDLLEFQKLSGRKILLFPNYES